MVNFEHQDNSDSSDDEGVAAAAASDGAHDINDAELDELLAEHAPSPSPSDGESTSSSSSSSDSTSSSSSGDSGNDRDNKREQKGQPVQPADRNERESEMNPRAPKNPELVLELPGIQGDLRWNQRGFFRAQCYHPGHGRTCRRQQQSTEGRFGAGRPIGLLIT